jgi:hypothetical protein
LVSEIRKAAVSRSASWTGKKKKFDLSEHVPLECDEEIDDVEITRVASCTCERS